jgi:hypothetical protein
MIHERRKRYYAVRKERAARGEYNCIPTPFARGTSFFPGIQQGKYYLVTGNTKSAKTSIANYLFVLHPVLFSFAHPDKLRVKIFYYSLEMSVNQLIDKFYCYYLYIRTRGAVNISPMELTSALNPVDESILAFLDDDKARAFFDYLESCVIFNEDCREPGEIFRECRDYALKRGQVKTRVNAGGEEVFDHYIANDPDEYRILLVDHYGLLQREKGMNLRETLQDFSSGSCVTLRNHYGFTVAGVMQQNAAKQGNETFRLDRLSPSVDGLAENKSVSQDVDMMLGIFSPWYFEKTNYQGYDVRVWRDNIRFLEVVLNRDGVTGSIIPLYYNGAAGFFRELPLPSEKEKLKEYQQTFLKWQ